jgi:hypothetical protein
VPRLNAYQKARVGSSLHSVLRLHADDGPSEVMQLCWSHGSKEIRKAPVAVGALFLSIPFSGYSRRAALPVSPLKISGFNTHSSIEQKSCTNSELGAFDSLTKF